MNRSRRRLCILVCAAIGTTGVYAQSAMEAGDAAALTLLRQAPETAADLQPRRALADAQLAALAPTTQPTTDAVAATPADALFAAWQAYRTTLDELDRLYAQIDALTSKAELAATAEAIEAVDAETAQLQNAATPAEATAQEVAELDARVRNVRAQVGVLRDAQAARARRLNGGYDEQRATLRAQLEALQTGQAALRQQAATQPATTQPTSAPALQIEQQAASVQTAQLELQLLRTRLEQQDTELRHDRDARLLAALGTQLNTLEARYTALVRARSADAVQTLEAQLATATSKPERKLLTLRLFVARTRMAVLATLHEAGTVRATDLRTQVQQLQAELAESEGRWTQTRDNLDQYVAGELRELRRRVRDEARMWRSRLATLVADQQSVRAQLDSLRSARQPFQEQFERLAEAAQTAVREAAGGPQALAEMQAAISDESTRLWQFGQAEVGPLRQARDEAAQLIVQLEEHIALLNDLSKAIQMRRLYTRDAGLLRTHWNRAARELAGVWDGLRGVGHATGPLDDARPSLLDPRSAARERTAVLLSHVRTASDAHALRAWGTAGGLLLVALLIGYVALRIARGRGVPLARQIAEDYARVHSPEATSALFGVAARIDLLLWNMIGDVTAIVLGAGALALATYLYVSSESICALIYAALALVAGTVTLIRLVHHLFEAESAPHRVIPCPDAVARHYRWWLVGFFVYGFVLLTPLTLLYIANLTPTLRDAGFAVFKTGLLVMTLLFLSSRRRVLGTARPAQSHWVRAVAYLAYPLIVLVVLTLLVLQVIGYGALVAYIGIGLAASLLTLLVVPVAAEYIVDLLEHRFEVQRTTRRSLTPANTEAEGRSYWLSLGRGIVRAAGLAAIVAALLWIWDIDVRGPWLSGQVVGFSALTVALAIVVDRVLSSALRALVNADRLPESTARLLERWLRGLLVLVTVLVIVAIAGYAIDSLWTFLTTLLAMIAIGFVAVWSILSNLLATFVILIWRPFNLGEEIEIMPDGVGGRVVDINFIYTVLRSEDGRMTAIPNNTFAQKFIRRTPLKLGRQQAPSLAQQLEAEKPIDDSAAGRQ